MKFKYCGSFVIVIFTCLLSGCSPRGLMQSPRVSPSTGVSVQVTSGYNPLFEKVEVKYRDWDSYRNKFIVPDSAYITTHLVTDSIDIDNFFFLQNTTFAISGNRLKFTGGVSPKILMKEVEGSVEVLFEILDKEKDIITPTGKYGSILKPHTEFSGA